MSELGSQDQGRSALRVDDIERALLLAREVAGATSKGGAANLRTDQLRALFAGSEGRTGLERIQAALEAAGLSVDPPLTDEPESVSLRVDRGRAALAPSAKAAPASPREPGGDEPPQRPSGVAAYEAASGGGGRRRSGRRPAPEPEGVPVADAQRRGGPATESEGVPLADAQRQLAAAQAEMRTPQSIAALMPAMIVPVLAASFLGPLFGAIFAGLALLTSATLSRPGALADGKLGPLRMPASLARSFLLVTSGVAIGALGMSLALIAAGGGKSTSSDPNAPLQQPKTTTQTTPSTTTPQQTTTTPAAPQPKPPTAAERKAAADRRARAQRRARARQRQATPPSGGGTTTTP